MTLAHTAAQAVALSDLHGPLSHSSSAGHLQRDPYTPCLYAELVDFDATNNGWTWKPVWPNGDGTWQDREGVQTGIIARELNNRPATTGQRVVLWTLYDSPVFTDGAVEIVFFETSGQVIDTSVREWLTDAHLVQYTNVGFRPDAQPGTQDIYVGKANQTLGDHEIAEAVGAVLQYHRVHIPWYPGYYQRTDSSGAHLAYGIPDPIQDVPDRMLPETFNQYFPYAAAVAVRDEYYCDASLSLIRTFS